MAKLAQALVMKTATRYLLTMSDGHASPMRPGVSRMLYLVVLISLILVSIAAFVSSALRLLPLSEANLLLASGGAMALGIMLASFGLYVRIQEGREIREFEIRLQGTERRLEEAIAFAEHVRSRFGHEDDIARLRDLHRTEDLDFQWQATSVPERLT